MRLICVCGFYECKFLPESRDPRYCGGGHVRAKSDFIYECDKMRNMTLIDALREDDFFLQGFVGFSLIALFIACVLITACFSKFQKVFKSKTNEIDLISSEITPV